MTILFVIAVYLFLVFGDFITCSICWSPGFVFTVFTCQWIVTATVVVLVFFVPHIKLVYFVFSLSLIIL